MKKLLILILITVMGVTLFGQTMPDGDSLKYNPFTRKLDLVRSDPSGKLYGVTIDSTGKADSSLVFYDEASGKYLMTVQIEHDTTGSGSASEVPTTQYVNKKIVAAALGGISEADPDYNAAKDTLTTHQKTINQFWNDKPFYSFDGTDDYLSIPDNDNFDFGTGDFSIYLAFKLNQISSNQALINKRDIATAGVGWSLFINTSNQVILLYDDNSSNNDTRITFSHPTLELNKYYNLVVIIDGVDVNAYLNGDLMTASGDLNSRSSCSNSNPVYIGTLDDGLTYNLKSYVSESKLYNFALTADDLDNEGRPLRKPEWEGASNTLLENGTVLIVGKYYRIDNVGTPTTDFTSYGAADNNNGTEFILSSALTLSTNDSLTQAGVTFSATPEGIGYFDWSATYGDGNRTFGDVSGATQTNVPVTHTEFIHEESITGDTQIESADSLIQKYDVARYITITNNGSASWTGHIGTTADGDNVSNGDVTIAAGETKHLVIGYPLSITRAYPLYIYDSGAGWTNVDLELLIENDRRNK